MTPAQPWWVAAGLQLPGLILVLALIGLALARVWVAAASPAGEQRRRERQLNLAIFPLALVSLGVVVLRFVELAH
jgi:hypothetical protein